MIINQNKSIERQTSREVKRRASISMNYQQRQLAKAIVEQNKIRLHNEKILNEKLKKGSNSRSNEMIGINIYIK